MTDEIWYEDVEDADADQDRQNTISFTYNDAGWMLSAGDELPGDAYTFDYDYIRDNLGRAYIIGHDLAGLSTPVAFIIAHDASGLRTGSLANFGGGVDYYNTRSYDDLGRQDRVDQKKYYGDTVAEKRVDFTYDAAGRFETITRYEDLDGGSQYVVATSTYAYDAAGRLVGLDHQDASQSNLAAYDWLFDAAGRMLEMDIDAATGTDGLATYVHDDTNQLTDAVYDGGWQDDEDYDYDLNGNRETANGATYVTGANNQLLGDGSYRYEYDPEGNRTLRYVDEDESETLNSGDTDITEYTWDHRNRLTKVEHFPDYDDYDSADPDKIVEYAYDHENRWVRKVLDSDGDSDTDASTIFVYDGNQIVLQFDKTGTGDATEWDLSHRYLWGPAVDQILADEQVSSLTNTPALATGRLATTLAASAT